MPIPSAVLPTRRSFANDDNRYNPVAESLPVPVSQADLRKASTDTIRPRVLRSQTSAGKPSDRMFLDFGIDMPAVNPIVDWTNSVSQMQPPTPLDPWAGLHLDIGLSGQSSVPGSGAQSTFLPATDPAKRSLSPPPDNDKIARPPNAWILYRSAKLAEFKALNPRLYDRPSARIKADRGARPTQANMSKTIAEWWAAEPPEVKDHYHQQAVIRTMLHQAEHPGKPLYANY